MKRLSEFAVVTLVETTDIGAGSATSSYVSMAKFDRAVAYNELGTWNGGDDLDGGQIQQATSSGGGSVKDLTSDGSGENYDTDAPLDADGDFLIIEIRAEDLDGNNSFTFIRTLTSEVTGTGTDNITTTLTRYDAAYQQAELQGAASAGSQVYVDTGT